MPEPPGAGDGGLQRTADQPGMRRDAVAQQHGPGGRAIDAQRAGGAVRVLAGVRALGVGIAVVGGVERVADHVAALRAVRVGRLVQGEGRAFAHDDDIILACEHAARLRSGREAQHGRLSVLRIVGHGGDRQQAGGLARFQRERGALQRDARIAVVLDAVVVAVMHDVGGLRREAAGHDVEVEGIAGDDIAGIGQHVRHLHAGAGDAVTRAARREQQRFHRRDPDLDDVGENADLPRVPGGQQRDIGLRAQDDACLRRIRDRGLGAGVAAEDGCPCRQQERGQRQRATGAPELARTARGRGWSRRAGCALLGERQEVSPIYRHAYQSFRIRVLGMTRRLRREPPRIGCQGLRPGEREGTVSRPA